MCGSSQDIGEDDRKACRRMKGNESGDGDRKDEVSFPAIVKGRPQPGQAQNEPNQLPSSKRRLTWMHFLLFLPQVSFCWSRLVCARRRRWRRGRRSWRAQILMWSSARRTCSGGRNRALEPSRFHSRARSGVIKVDLFEAAAVETILPNREEGHRIHSRLQGSLKGHKILLASKRRERA